MAHRIALLVGGLSRAAVSGRVSRALEALQPPSIAFERLEIRDLPFYNQDLETDSPPPPWARFREAIRAADGILFVTPEYNRGVPAALKNAVDVGSRPPAANVWTEKPVGIVSTSTGALGGFGANHQLRQNLSFSAVQVMLRPEMYLGRADKVVTEEGQPADDKTREFLVKFLDAFAAWVGKHAARPAKA
jgi:chromate reductase